MCVCVCVYFSVSSVCVCVCVCVSVCVRARGGGREYNDYRAFNAYIVVDLILMHTLLLSKAGAVSRGSPLLVRGSAIGNDHYYFITVSHSSVKLPRTLKISAASPAVTTHC